MMDWVYMAPDLPGDMLVTQDRLGFSVGDDYRVDPDAVTSLQNITGKLKDDDRTLHTFRKSLAFSRIVEKDLAPMLRSVLKTKLEEPGSSANSNADSAKVQTSPVANSQKLDFDSFEEKLLTEAVRLLCQLTTPIECLVCVEDLVRTKEGGLTLGEIKQYHSDVKDAFSDPKLVKIVLRFLEFLLNKSNSAEAVKVMQMADHENILEAIKMTVTLVRNILHIPTPRPADDSVNVLPTSVAPGAPPANRQNSILWSLFCNDIDVILVNLIASRHVRQWSSAIMQIVALVYKDQHVQTLERLLSQWLETSLSESSEDNESNTSPAERCVEESAEDLTSSAEPTTDDSSDGNGRDETSSGGEKEEPKNAKKEKEEPQGAKAEDGKDQAAVVVGKRLTSSSPRSEIGSDISTDSCGKEPPCKRQAFPPSPECAGPVNETSREQPKPAPDKTPSATAHVAPEPMEVESEAPTLVKDAMKKDSGYDRSGNGGNGESGGSGPGTASRNNGEVEDYVAMEKQEVKSNSSSSNDEVLARVTPHTNLQKPRPKQKNFTPSEKRELRRQKLIKRSKTNRLKVKAMVHHIPTDEDIAELLTEFTVDFLLKGFSNLVSTARKNILLSETSQNLHMEQSHYLWLVTYFLKFSAQLEVELEQVGRVLSIETLSYLTFEGVRLYEDHELCIRDRNSEHQSSGLRGLHLLVTAISEFIVAIETFTKFRHLPELDKERLFKVRKATCSFSELRSLLLLLIRRFNPSIQTRQYLTDLINCHHNLLVLTEHTHFDTKAITQHLSQFATLEVMRQYGYVLEQFRTNSPHVNDAIFTMMHHVSGDLGAPEALFVPQILATFSDMWEQAGAIEICDVWTDLIEYVIQKFITTMGTRPLDCASNLLECIQDSKISEAVDKNGFTKSQLESLHCYYAQSEDTADTVGAIIENYRQHYNVTKSRLSVIQALLSQGIITLAQYMSLMYMKSVLSPCKNEHEGSVIAEVGSEHYDSEHYDALIMDPDQNKTPSQKKDQIEVLKELLKVQGKDTLITWLQQILLEACYVKLNGGQMVTSSDATVEPTAYYFNLINKSIPIVAWNKQQESGLQTETFIMLLHKLGFHLAADVGRLFPRIPHFWSAEHIVQVINKLGPIRNRDRLKMNLAVLDCSDSGLLAASEDLWGCNGGGDVESPPSDCYYTNAFAAAALAEQAPSSVDGVSSVCVGPGDDSTISGSEFAIPAAPQMTSNLMASLVSGVLVTGRPMALTTTARSKSVTCLSTSVTTLSSSNTSVIRSALQGACSNEMTSGSCSAEMTGGSGSNDDDLSDPTVERMQVGGGGDKADADSCIDSGIGATVVADGATVGPAPTAGNGSNSRSNNTDESDKMVTDE